MRVNDRTIGVEFLENNELESIYDEKMNLLFQRIQELEESNNRLINSATLSQDEKELIIGCLEEELKNTTGQVISLQQQRLEDKQYYKECGIHYRNFTAQQMIEMKKLEEEVVEIRSVTSKIFWSMAIITIGSLLYARYFSAK